MTATLEKIAKNGRIAAAPDAPAVPEKAIVLPRIQRSTIVVPIIGTTPLIPHRWSEKALGMMRDKQFQTRKVAAREAKNPHEEARMATYWLEDGRPGMPATAFKGAMVGACRIFGSDVFPMTKAKLALYVEGEGVEQLVPIVGEYSMREDTPRNSGGTVDLRYRNYFTPWSASLKVQFITSMITADSVIALIEAAGIGGIGDWRPSAPKSSTGTFGQFRVDPHGKIAIDERA